MTRQLRPRKNRISYVALAGLDHDTEESEETRAGPSSGRRAMLVDEADSESEFAPEVAVLSVHEDQAGEDSEEDAMSDVEDVDVERDDEEAPTPALPKPKTRKSTIDRKGKGKVTAKGKGKAKKAAAKAPSAKAAAIPVAPKGKMYSLPTPSVHHRHRAVPLFSRSGQSERLAAYPHLFASVPTVLTNSLTANASVLNNVVKSWGYNIGSGPLWELVEDRGWFKEAISEGPGVDRESKRRPRVYSDVKVRAGWEVLSVENAAPYLPSADATTEEGNLQAPPPLPCYFGHITSQARHEVKMFETFAMSQYQPESKAHVFNAGAPVWSIDWCPIHPDDRPRRQFKQYLAVAPFPSHSHSPDIGRKVARPSFACIQMWSLSSSQPRPRPQQKSTTNKNTQQTPDLGKMRCEMVLCLDTGPAYNLKWCPLPSHEENDSVRPKKLGLLGAITGDGSFALFVVPDPEDVRLGDHDEAHPIYLRLPQPILRIELEETSCWALDWANSSVIAIGTTTGTIAVYDLGPALKSPAATDPSQPPMTDVLPTHYLTVHQSAVRALAWIKAPPTWPSGKPRVDQDPTVIVSGGYDGMECMTDIREGRGVVMNRTRDVINTLVFSPFAGGAITMDHENTVKAYSASASMLGRGHSLFEPQGPVWSVHASEYHPQLVVGAADGTCSTTNTLTTTRRGGTFPFFVHIIFQMDYNRNTKEYRMLDQFLPQESIDRPAAIRNATVKAKASGSSNSKRALPPNFVPSTGAWSTQVGVHTVAWNNGNGLASSGLVAAGTASGLCRVDVLWGKWIRDKKPYGGVEGIRMEGRVKRDANRDSDAMEVDEDEDAEGEEEDQLWEDSDE